MRKYFICSLFVKKSHVSRIITLLSYFASKAHIGSLIVRPDWNIRDIAANHAQGVIRSILWKIFMTILIIVEQLRSDFRF